MPQTVPVYFAPDIDTAWGSNPGALALVNAFAPMQLGCYGSMGLASYLSGNLTGKDGVNAYMFRQIDGTVRLLYFRANDIDEYDSSGTRTNRATGLTTATTWSATAWGNQIIACSYTNATKSSTGGAFSSLAGAPKARFVASNVNFVMLADTDDGATPYQDEVYWSGLQDPATWTTGIATQCGRIRLLDAPGPIRALVAYRDTFVAFKDNAMFVGEYVGPSFVFAWRMVSNRIGCVAPGAVAELDGKLYFPHSSGFYEFDGNAIRNVGVQVFHSFLVEVGYITKVSGDTVSAPVVGLNQGSFLTTQVVADDVEGVVWFSVGFGQSNFTARQAVQYGYNVRTGRWGRFNGTIGDDSGATAPSCILVKARFADIQAFKAVPAARYLQIISGSTNSTLQTMEYPVATSTVTGTTVQATATTGVFGSSSSSSSLSRVQYRTLAGTDDDSGITVTATGYTSENKNKTNGSKACSYNSEFDVADGIISSRFTTLQATWAAGKKTILAGMGPEYVGGSKR